MIIYEDNFLNHSEINHLFHIWDNNKNASIFSEYVISFYYIDLMKYNHLDLTPIHNNAFKRKLVHKMRLQKYDETFSQIKEYHGHEDIYNYIIFLNDDFTGGELEFENGIIIKPKKGSLVYFNNNEKHRVLPCIGERYVFTSLGDNELDIKFKIREKQKIII